MRCLSDSLPNNLRRNSHCDALDLESNELAENHSRDDLSLQASCPFWPHRLVLRPREGHDVRIEEMRLEIEPEFELEWSRDLFGNSVATAHS